MQQNDNMASSQVRKEKEKKLDPSFVSGTLGPNSKKKPAVSTCVRGHQCFVGSLGGRFWEGAGVRNRGRNGDVWVSFFLLTLVANVLFHSRCILY